MLVDIHTHNPVTPGYTAIRNLTFTEADKILASEEEGFFSLGFHPWHAGDFSTGLMDKLSAWATDNRLVAIGECGLDKNSRASFEVQLPVFKQQIVLSEESHKPLIIHCVGGFNELFRIKKEMNPHQRWIIHGFRGKPELAKQALKAGCALSFGEQFNSESVRITPIDRLFVETDESTLPISGIYHSISMIRNCKVEELTAGQHLLNRFLQKGL
ncbi:MAG: TatD family hydrolase [Bacteroidota bacterium]|nr:TatD family hydrolase [Bacteroidota bacterium]